MSSHAGVQNSTEADRLVLDACFERLYSNIRALASRLGWTNNPTLNPTALAHESYLKLRRDPPHLADKSHGEIIAIFANAMRQILVDAVRRKNARKRLHEGRPESTPLPVEHVLAVAMALEDLSRVEPQQGRIAEARFLLGMTAVETATALGVSLRTVEREWQEARTRLSDKLQNRTE